MQIFTMKADDGDEHERQWAYAVKLHAGGKCQLCPFKAAAPDYAGLEAHHNEYCRKHAKAERIEDGLCLCFKCHAIYEWIRQNEGPLMAFACAIIKRTHQIRFALENVHEFYQGQVREFESWAGEWEERAALLMAMTGAGREHDERRAA